MSKGALRRYRRRAICRTCHLRSRHGSDRGHLLHQRELTVVEEKGYHLKMAVGDAPCPFGLAVGIYAEERPYCLRPIPSALPPIKETNVEHCVFAVVLRDFFPGRRDILKRLDLNFLRFGTCDHERMQQAEIYFGGGTKHSVSCF